AALSQRGCARAMFTCRLPGNLMNTYSNIGLPKLQSTAGPCGLLALALVSAPVFAQTAPTEEGVLDTVVVTARKRSESATSVPEAITAISSAQIESAGIRNLMEVSALTPNMVITSGSGTAYPSIMVRGLAQAQGGEAPVA